MLAPLKPRVAHASTPMSTPGHQVLVKVDRPHLIPNALQRGLHAQLLHVGPTRQDLKVNIWTQAHIPCLDLEDLNEALLYGDAHVKLTVEPTGPVSGSSAGAMSFARQ